MVFESHPNKKLLLQYTPYFADRLRLWPMPAQSRHDQDLRCIYSMREDKVQISRQATHAVWFEPCQPLLLGQVQWLSCKAHIGREDGKLLPPVASLQDFLIRAYHYCSKGASLHAALFAKYCWSTRPHYCLETRC